MMADLIAVTDDQLEEILSKALTKALGKRLKGIEPHPVRSCICADVMSKAKHEADHEIIRRIGETLDRVENAKWGFLMLIAAAVVTGVSYALWEGIKSVAKR